MIAAPRPGAFAVRPHLNRPGRQRWSVIAHRDEAATFRPSAAEAFTERCLDVGWGLKMRQRVARDDYDVNACHPQRQSAAVGNDTAERKVTRGSFTLGSIDGSVREIGTCHPEPDREESKRL